MLAEGSSICNQNLISKQRYLTRCRAVWISFGFGALLIFSNLSSGSANELKWVEVSADYGITVWSRARAGKKLPELRADGEITAEIFHTMSVILDAKRSPEWVPDCIESRELLRVDERTTLVYNVTNSPWPIWDRDAVVRVVVEKIDPKGTYRVLIEAQPDVMPLVDGRIRIPYSEVYFILQRIDAEKTWVEYGLNVDPGGRLPKWMIRSTVRNTMVDTIKGLEMQATKMRGLYRDEAAALKKMLQ